MNSQIIPTIFSQSKEEFLNRFNLLSKFAPSIQIDVMDGKFVNNTSIPLSDIPNLKKIKNKFEVHLMVYHPEKYIEKLSSKGFKKIIFHIESYTDQEGKSVQRLIEKIKSQNIQAFIAINPETPLERILPYVSSTDGILFMGVHPGKEHKSFIPEVYKKIKKLKTFNKSIIVQVDGGVSPNNIDQLANIDADILNTGSYVSDSKNPIQAFKILDNLFKKAKSKKRGKQ
ncbi:MAG: ribulose-phosphate 3-epimerase [Nanoarchaeota archaeon]|nr:ribulose-phosphate 3-epimerase [Nanoarchaeota archaeon]